MQLVGPRPSKILINGHELKCVDGDINFEFGLTKITIKQKTKNATIKILKKIISRLERPKYSATMTMTMTSHIDNPPHFFDQFFISCRNCKHHNFDTGFCNKYDGVFVRPSNICNDYGHSDIIHDYCESDDIYFNHTTNQTIYDLIHR
jgi:hypothetical protein